MLRGNPSCFLAFREIAMGPPHSPRWGGSKTGASPLNSYFDWNLYEVYRVFDPQLCSTGRALTRRRTSVTPSLPSTILRRYLQSNLFYYVFPENQSTGILSLRGDKRTRSVFAMDGPDRQVLCRHHNGGSFKRAVTKPPGASERS
jgi:hypothetical protein